MTRLCPPPFPTLQLLVESRANAFVHAEMSERALAAAQRDHNVTQYVSAQAALREHAETLASLNRAILFGAPDVPLSVATTGNAALFEDHYVPRCHRLSADLCGQGNYTHLAEMRPARVCPHKRWRYGWLARRATGSTRGSTRFLCSRAQLQHGDP